MKLIYGRDAIVHDYISIYNEVKLSRGKETFLVFHINNIEEISN
jgi:hypothetical protein